MLATLALAAVPQRERPARSMRADLLGQNGAEQCGPSEGAVPKGLKVEGSGYGYEPIQLLVGHDLGVCACAKCGTTSLGQYMYEAVTGEAWKHTDSPWVQAYHGERWPSGTWKDLTDVQLVAKSIAFVREPVGRLISAWVDKIGGDTGAASDSRKYVCNLVYAEGRNRTVRLAPPPCTAASAVARTWHEHSVRTGSM
mgnify:CR=1 FL=1